MSERFESCEEVACKIMWEGGIFEVLDYGLKSTRMPEGDTELIEAWQKLEAAYSVAERLAGDVEKLLPEVTE